MKNVSRSTPISLPSFPSFFSSLSLFFSFPSPLHWPISPQEFSSIILDFCSPLCYAGYVGNVARNLEMVRGLQSPIFRGGMELHWVLGSFSPPLLPNLSLSSSPPFLSPSFHFFPFSFFFYISHHFYFSSHTLPPVFLVSLPLPPCLFLLSVLSFSLFRLSIHRIYDLFRPI